MKQLINSILKASPLFLVMALIILSGCQQPKPDPSEEMKPIVDKLEDAWNGRNIDALDAIFAPDFVRIVNNQPEANGVKDIKKLLQISERLILILN